MGRQEPGDPSTIGTEPTRRADWLLALGVAVTSLVALLATGPDFGMVWDEGYTVRRERLLDDWFEGLVNPPWPGGRSSAFERKTFETNWPFSREEPHGHPPFYALLGLAGWRLSHHWLAPLEAYRFGPMALTATTLGLVYLHLARRVGRPAGFTASALLLLMPRVFAHAHYAHYDMPMTCLWLLAQVSFVASLGSRRWAVPFGIILGLCAGTKFTGLFAIAPALAWVAIFEVLPRVVRLVAKTKGEERPGRSGLEALGIGLPISLLTIYAIQPPWWLSPISGPYRFFASNLTRAKTQPLPTLYLGETYAFSLPWHNTLVLSAVTTPVAVLALGLIGIAASVAGGRKASWVVIWPLSWATLMVVRALPMAPGHDGIRLFLPSVASLAVLAGLGVSWLLDSTRRSWVRQFGRVLAVLALGECLIGIARTYPYTDSYYNLAIGGLKGAERHGFELTYYWETTGPEFLEWVRGEARRGPVELCFTMDASNHDLLREWGDIPANVSILDLNTHTPNRPKRPSYVLQRRRGFYFPRDSWLERHGHPTFVIRREGVDLLRVYPFGDFVDAARQGTHEPIPAYLNR